MSPRLRRSIGEGVASGILWFVVAAVIQKVRGVPITWGFHAVAASLFGLVMIGANYLMYNRLQSSMAKAEERSAKHRRRLKP